MAKSIKVSKVSRELWERIDRAAKAGGYSSPQEFGEHVLDKYVPKSVDTDSKDEILKRLKGLATSSDTAAGHRLRCSDDLGLPPLCRQRGGCGRGETRPGSAARILDLCRRTTHDLEIVEAPARGECPPAPLVLVPFLILTIASAPLFLLLEKAYGAPPLVVGKPAVATMPFDASAGSVPQLIAPHGISVETPHVIVSSLHEVSWRNRPLRALSGDLHWKSDRLSLSKGIAVAER